MNHSVKDYLDGHKITYELFTHPAVFTVEEAHLHCAHIQGMHGKNLFLKDPKGNFILVILPATKRLDMKSLAAKVGVPKLRFGSEEELLATVGVPAGSVSPLCLINNSSGTVKVIIDEEFWNADLVCFHPNDNTMTISVGKDQFHKLMKSFKNEQRIISLG